MTTYTVKYSGKSLRVREASAGDAIERVVNRYINNFGNLSIKMIDADTHAKKWAIGRVQYATRRQNDRGEFDTIRIEAEVSNA